MDKVASLNMAIDLMRAPAQVRAVRSAPLPDGVLTLLCIAAEDEEATRQAIAATGRSRETLREAAAFFIEQILFCPDADSYRVLGARPEASNGELRHNMALLLRWLHPDHDPQAERSVFASRVTRAWNDLKTQERRAAYDRSRRIALLDKSLLRKKARTYPKKQPSLQRPHNSAPYHRHGASRPSFKIYPERAGFLRQVLLSLLGKVVR
jgi:DnaJ-like protein